MEDSLSNSAKLTKEILCFCDSCVRQGIEDVREILRRWEEKAGFPESSCQSLSSAVELHIKETWDFPHGPADFKALREQLGINKHVLAEMLSVRVKSVGRWEELKAEYVAPLEAWNILFEYEVQQELFVANAVKIITEQNEEISKESPIMLTYWNSERAFRGTCKQNECPNWEMANANTRLLATELRRLGYKVSFCYGSKDKH